MTSTTNRRYIEVLNSLVAATLDSARGYAAAADHGVNPRFRGLFKERADARRRLASALETELRAMVTAARDPETRPSPPRSLFRDFKSLATGSDAAIVEAIEARERVVKSRFAEVLHAQVLPPSVARVVNEVYAIIQADKDRLRALASELRARPSGRMPAPPESAGDGNSSGGTVIYWREAARPALVSKPPQQAKARGGRHGV